jgi:hypothetical protein
MDPVEAGESEPYQREVVLAQQDCLRRTGLIAYSGPLTLSTHRIRFEPTGTLDRLVGADEMQIRIDEITEISYSKLEMVLGIRTRNTSHRFSGHGARRIHRRLQAFINERDGKANLKRDFQPDERVIIHEFGSLARSSEEASKGEYLLTDRRLRFQPTGRLERGFDAPTLLDVHLSQVSDFEYDARHRVLIIHAATIALGEEPVTYQISGGRVAEIHAHLSAWAHLSQKDNDDENEEVDFNPRSHSVEGSVHRGPLQTNGLISIGADAISFVPTGKLDVVLLSAKMVTLPFEEICSVAIRGWPTARICIRSSEQEVELSTDKLEHWFERLIQDYEDWLEKRTTIDEEEEEAVLGSALASWRFAVERDALEETLFSIPAIFNVGPLEFRSGILAQARGLFRFAPIHAAKNEEVLEVPVSEIAREYTEIKHDNQIRFRAFRTRYSFTPAGGRKAVSQFWIRCRIPARVLRGSQLRRHGYSRLTGAGSHIRLNTSMGSVFEAAPTWILAHADGIGVVAPGVAGRSRFPGQSLSIEIRRHDGVYEFDTVALWAELLPTSIKMEDRAEFHLLIVEAPDEVRIYNERRTFRVPTEVQIRAFEMVKFNPQGEEIPTEEIEAVREEMPADDRRDDTLTEWTFGLGTFLGTMIDLSAEGCGMHTPEPMIVGMRVSVDLTVEGRMLSLHARVVWVQPPEHEGLPYICGLEFQSLTQDQINALTKVVMQMQRERLGDN